MNPHDVTQAENYKQVINIVSKSAVILAAINTPYIMEYSGRYKDYAGIDEMEHVIKMSLQDGGDKLILFVPIKCEKYTRSPQDRERLINRVKDTFANTLNLSANPIYKDKLAMALIPVHTVGNAYFSRFDIKDGNIINEVYLKNRSTKFNPKDADQPLRYALSFLLAEFKKSSGGFWNAMLDFVFARDNLAEISNFIRKGIKADSDGFKIFCGRNLIEI